MRIVEGRNDKPLGSLWDIQKIKGLGPSAMREVAAAFGLQAPESLDAQISLFPDVDEFDKWKNGEEIH